MSIVVITGSGPEHKYFANNIAATHKVQATLICANQDVRRWRVVFGRSRTEFLGKALRAVFLAIIRDKRKQKQSLRRVLGACSEEFIFLGQVEEVGPPKGKRLFDRISELQPNIIVVYGTGIIPNSVLKMASTVALNMHTGLSPWYRGTASHFWAIHDGRPEMVGATVHECTMRVDGGRIYSRKRAKLYRGDDLHAIFARAVEVGTASCINTISDVVSGRLEGEEQDKSVGKEFRGSMRLLSHELKVRYNIRRLSPGWSERKN